MHAIAPEQLPAADLRDWLSLGLERCGSLLTAGEQQVVRRMLALRGPAARAWALLCSRRSSVFRRDRLSIAGVEPLDEALDELARAGLVCALVGHAERLEAATRDELSEGCRHLGLPRSGSRALLQERLRSHPGWSTAPHVRLLHQGLVLRLSRIATLSLRPDPSERVLERLGLVQWVDYTVTSGPALFATRGALMRWERAAAALEHDGPEALIERMAHLPSAPAGLSLRGRTRRQALELARELERSGELARAEALYVALIDHGLAAPARVAVRLARCRELQGRTEDALHTLSVARPSATLPQRIGLARPARRLARKLRRAWPPSAPLREPKERVVPLTSCGGDGYRPLWDGGDGPTVVEAAVLDLARSHGREGIFAENGLWSALFGLLMAEHLFAPVPGALPVPRLTAPLDLGTPAFRARRPEVEVTLGAIASGEAPELLAIAQEQFARKRLAGSWSQRLSDDALVAAARALPGVALAEVCRRLCDQGLRAARGFPDLLILPGASVRLPGAFPSKLGEDGLLVEVKGPGDTLRDGQVAWLHELVAFGAAVEVWRIVSL